MGPAKPDHDGLHLSATRTDTFTKCNRKWAFEYIAKIPYPPSPWLAFGTLFHAHLERYFTNGQMADLSWIVKTLNKRTPYQPTEDEIAAKLAMGSLKHWPRYEPGRFAPERPFRYEMPHGIFTGTVDLPDLRIRQIGDHKTTVSLKWAPTVDELLVWPQPVAYSYHTARELEWKENDCKWVYTEKKTAATKIVLTPKMPFSYWEDQWLGTFEPATKTMAELYAQRADPMELSPAKDTSFCDAYGGCPFKALCTDVDHSTSLLGGFDDMNGNAADNSDMLDDLLGTEPDAPAQEVGNTVTKEAPADLSALDDLLNPPAGGQAAVESKAPPLADPTPSAATTAKAAAENAAKPPKVTKPKATKPAKNPDVTPEGQAALDALKAMRTEPAAPVADAPKAIQGVETKVIAPPTPRPDQGRPEPVSPTLAAEIDRLQADGSTTTFMPDFMRDALGVLVSVYLNPTTALGKSGPAAVSAVQLLSQHYQGSDLVIRACDTIVTLRRAFGDV